MDYVERPKRCRAIKVNANTTAPDLADWTGVMVPAPGVVLYPTEGGGYLTVTLTDDQPSRYLIDERGTLYTKAVADFEGQWALAEDE